MARLLLVSFAQLRIVARHHLHEPCQTFSSITLDVMESKMSFPGSNGTADPQSTRDRDAPSLARRECCPAFAGSLPFDTRVHPAFDMKRLRNGLDV